jgi:zinc transporter ZupT
MFARFLAEEHLDEDHHDEEPHDDDKPWGDVILASFLVQLVTLSGIVLMASIGLYGRIGKRDTHTIWAILQTRILPAFAAGALLAAAVFLMIPESLELLGGGHEDHEEESTSEFLNSTVEDDHNSTSDVDHSHFRRFLEAEGELSSHGAGPTWKFGASLLAGLLMPILLTAIFPVPDIEDCDVCEKLQENEDSALSPAAAETVREQNEEANSDKANTEDKTTMDDGCDAGACGHPSHVNKADDGTDDSEVSVNKLDKSKSALPLQGHAINWGLASSILLGDAFHNFCDGLFIGNAFLLCSREVAYTIVATTIYHEFAQELADFALLVHHCGLGRVRALLLNFVSGLSVLIGALIILASDLSDQATGSILAISAGVYIYIAASECIPRIQAKRKTIKDTLIFVLCFATGAVPIGLVLLNHGHCEAGHDHEEEDH